ncbi:pyruvate formate lyase family protein [Escherichia coli]
MNRFEKYGNDIDEVDNISAELLRHYCKEVGNTITCAAVDGIGYRFCSRPVGIGGWRHARRSFCRRTAGRGPCYRRWARTNKGQQRY